MWQVVLGAAIAAGSTGLVAKRFFNPFSPHPPFPEDHSEEEQEHVTTPVGIGFLGSPCEKTNGVFRFKSSGSAGSGSGSSPGFRKSPGVTCKVKVRGLMKQKKNENNGGGSEIEKRSGNVSLKKPRTLSADSASKRGVSCYNNNQDHSTFSSALGVCMMYMMSAEKNEMSKLHTATEETVKVIQELKDELSWIKSLQGFKSSGKSDLTTKTEIASGEESVDTKSGKDGGYASSVLTEEPEHEAVEMEQLEIELESELQKLNLAETSELMEECKELVNGSGSYQCGGISASELDKKLSRLLIEQQEGQINELEAELQTTQSKLQEKEAELQALKVCVRRLTEFPLLDRSDDEHEQDMNQELSVSWSQRNQTDKEERKPVVGMKRPMEPSIHV
ncbi:BnaC01g39010D [Brassica napus]|uniref:BnaC01g39010D protein n=1 Tax=Brassica napus TaxID=3708 RepID=A0A078G6W3_BRANA|nr:BnaC01g39010D [Brassica napus]